MKRFFIVANTEKDIDYNFSKSICEYIEKKGAVCSYLKNENEYVSEKNIPKDCECIIVLGGDGTLIQTARRLYSLNIPIFGVNIGTLGYLTDVDGKQIYSALDMLLCDKIYTSTRMLIEGKVIRDGEVVFSDIALNDIVLNRVGPLRVIGFDISVNGEFLINYNADGLIVATPTGSTAYNLSAGGPIIKPEKDIILVTPVCPHTLYKSSLIFDGSDEIEIYIAPSKSGFEERAVTFDGEKSFNLISGDKLVITKSENIVRLIQTGKHNYLQILRNKMS